METEYIENISENEYSELSEFLEKNGITPEEKPESSVIIRENGNITATASVSGELIKYAAVDFEHRGSGLTAALITEIRKRAFEKGKKRLFLVTKPENRAMFESLLFGTVVAAESSVLMEYPAGGIDSFLSTVPKMSGEIGAIVMNANPFTKGHRYLIEKASSECDGVYVFVLSEEKSEFSAAERLERVKKGTADLDNVIVLPTENYLVSEATFPGYFLRKSVSRNEAFCELDIAVFGEKFVPALGISRRYVGTEPFSETTAAYNKALSETLFEYGIELRIVERLKDENGEAISASKVRRLLSEGSSEEAEKLIYRF